MKKLLSQVIAAGLGLWLATMFVPRAIIKIYPETNFFGAPLTALWQIILVLGIILGLLNYFVKPILKAISLPLAIITLGLFSVIINMGMLWFIDIMFDELYIPWFFPLFDTTLIIWLLNFLIQKILVKRDE